MPSNVDAVGASAAAQIAGRPDISSDKFFKEHDNDNIGEALVNKVLRQAYSRHPASANRRAVRNDDFYSFSRICEQMVN